MQFSTIIFDLDGTISDPLQGIAASINHSLVVHGLEPVSESSVAGLIGPPLDWLFQKLTGASDERLLASCITCYRERYGKVGYSENALYDGVVDVLHSLKQSGYVLGVCTSKRRDFALRILELFQIDTLFAFVDGGDVGISKAEQMARLRAEGCFEENAVMIGDRDVDLQAAHGVGIASIGVLWGYGSREELSVCRPMYIARTPDQLLEYVQANK